MGSNEEPITTDFLIAGAGPAGASLACFLSRAPYNLKGIMIAAQPSTSLEPRAHITNPAALECLRDIDLEPLCLARATAGDNMLHTRWCHTMTGEEFARIPSWGNDPARKGDYEAATPCRHVDLPQTEFEPIMCHRAAEEGWQVRFSTTFLTMREDKSTTPPTILSTIRDEVTHREFVIRSRYLFGADGARSQVMRTLQIPLIRKPGQGLAWNVLVDCDLSTHMKVRTGNLHWVFQPERPYPDYAWSGLIRMVKPWHEWMFIIFPLPDKPYVEPSREEWMRRVREIIGDDSIPAKILRVDKWNINEIVAEYYSYPPSSPPPNNKIEEPQPVHCLGDAVHRHPPFNGLGSNTCVQDAFNLSWKVAYVHLSLAGPGLLTTFSPERQPVGVGVITRANMGLRDHTPVWDAMGVALPTVSERMAVFNELKAPTAAGRARRKRLHETIRGTAHEFHGLGVEMNHRYEMSKGAAVVSDDEPHAPPAWPDDPILYHKVTTYPGHRLPHAWINTRLPGKQISTIDLAGHGCFCLLTGIGGDAWKAAAKQVSEELGLDKAGVGIRAYSIGWCQDWEDVYGDWEERREVEEDGCLLVRPDRFVAWRSSELLPDCTGRLREVMRRLLFR